MKQDVFISYSTPDKPVAEQVCAALEARGVNAWIAPRDIRAGAAYAAAIADALAHARVMVLVFSAHANRSPNVVKELELAHQGRLEIIAVRIEEVQPEAALKYYLAGVQWMDALTRPLDSYLTSLADLVARLLGLVEKKDGGGGVRTAGGQSVDNKIRPDRRLRPHTRGWAALLACVVTVVALGAWWTMRGELPAGPPTLAVLPFENIGGAGEEEYFVDGLTDEVRSKLMRLRGMQLIASTSSVQYKKTQKTSQEISRELGADHLLIGKARWDRTRGEGVSRVRVSLELVRVVGGRSPATLWHESFDAAVADIFDVQSRIATDVAEALDVALAAPERRALATRPTRNLAAYAAFLRGEALVESQGGPGTTREAAKHYEEAISHDPEFVLAWAQLSHVRTLIATETLSSAVDAELARKAAEEAVRLGPDQPEGYLALGTYVIDATEDPQTALQHYRRAQQLAPQDARVLGSLGHAEREIGQWDAAVEHLRQAQRLDPRSAVLARRTGYTLLLLRRYDEARQFYDLALALQPTNLTALEEKAMMALMQGDLAGARAVVQAAPPQIDQAAIAAFFGYYSDLHWVLTEEQQKLLLTLSPAAFDGDEAGWAVTLAQTHAFRGDMGSARKLADTARRSFEALLKEAPTDGQLHALYGLALAYQGRGEEAIKEGLHAISLTPLSKYYTRAAYVEHQLVRIYILLGDFDAALERLEPLSRRHYYLTPGWLRIDPHFAPLRKHPRFQRLVNAP